MSPEFVPIIFEECPAGWLKTRFPHINILAIAAINEQRYHVLLSQSDADMLRSYLLKDLVPPFCRRRSGSSNQVFEPGLVFSSSERHRSGSESRCIAESYRTALAQLTEASARDYVYAKIRELDQQQLRANL